MLNRHRLSQKNQNRRGSIIITSPIEFGKYPHWPSDYVPCIKILRQLIRIEGTAFGGAKIELDVKLVVQDFQTVLVL